MITKIYIMYLLVIHKSKFTYTYMVNLFKQGLDYHKTEIMFILVKKRWEIGL